MRLRGATGGEPAGGRPRRFGSFGAPPALAALRGDDFLCTVLGAFACMYRHRIAGDVANHAFAQVFASQGLMRAGGQTDSGKLGKRAAERRLAGQRPVRLKTQQAPEHALDEQAAAQPSGPLKAQYGLGYKRLCQGQAAALGCTCCAARITQ